MKKLIILVALVGLYSCSANNTVTKQHKTFLIKAVGEIEVQPNMASFEINLNANKPNFKEARKALTDETNNLTAKLLKLGLEKKDLQNSRMGISKEYDWIRSQKVFAGYRAYTTLTVTLRNIDKLDQVYAELIEDESININNLNYAHSKIDSLENIAYINALKRSDEISEELLKELPESKKEILNLGNVKIEQSRPNSNLINYEADYNRESLGNSVSFNTGSVKVKTTLFVEYLIK